MSKFTPGEDLERRRLVENRRTGVVSLGWEPCVFVSYNSGYPMIKFPNGVMEVLVANADVDLRRREKVL